MKPHRLLLKNASQVLQVCPTGSLFVPGQDMNSVVILENHSIAISHEGIIVAMGPTEEIEASHPDEQFDTVIDCSSYSLVPGLVDPHTHPVWAGDRVHEFELKMKGATYMEIHQAGGGIGFTVGHTRSCDEPELSRLFDQRLSRMTRNGTTLVEAKSGYGLNLQTEMKMLRVIHEGGLRHEERIEVVGTYLGAHSVPKMDGLTVDEYTEEIITTHLPALAEAIQSGSISPSFADVFLERNVFGREQTRRILDAAFEQCGLVANFHGDELTCQRSGELAAELSSCAAVSHLEHIDENGMAAMAESNVAAVLLPTTAYVLRIEYPPAREMIDSNMVVALATDYNPNAHCSSMPFVMNLSCVNMKMSLNECLVASTINAAYALKKSSTHGSLEVGKFGDVVVVASPDWRHIIYEMGGQSPIAKVVKKGNVVFEDEI